MKTSTYTNFDGLPVYLNAKMVADILGIGETSAYNLMKQRGFPSMRINRRILVDRDRFFEWVEKKACA